MRVKEKETDIQAAICQYLALKRYFFWRNNNIPVFSEGRFRAMPKFSLKGIPDIIVLNAPHGQFIGLEVKRQGGTLSSHQRQFQANSEAIGARYHVVTSVGDVISLGL